MIKKSILIITTLSLLLSCSDIMHNEDVKGRMIGDDAVYLHEVPGTYVRLKGLAPHDGGFGIEPNTNKGARVRRYVLMVDYDCEELKDSDEKLFRDSTGEREGLFLHSDAFPGHRILSHWIDKIIITSNADFNDIPAGKSISSKVMIFTWSAWPSIKAKKDIGQEEDLYNAFYNYFYTNPKPGCPAYSSLTKSMVDLSEDDLYLLGSGKYPVLFMFTELPEIKQHLFTITYYEGENSWSLDIAADFAVSKVCD